MSARRLLADVDWTAVLLEGAAGVVAAVLTLAAVIVGARVYHEGARARRPDVHDDDDEHQADAD